ncbi:MAG: hypothetical protein AAGB06_00175 [Verrucomicrobiota bacterium]
MNSLRKIVIYGSGLRGREILNYLPPQDQVLFFVDVESEMHGQSTQGYTIYPTEVLTRARFDKVVLATRENQNAYCQLIEMGIDPDKIISPLMSPENLHGLSNLRNHHKSDSLFVIGNGDSLNASDLEAIAATGQPTIAFNDIFNWYGSTSFRPTYYIVEDPIFARKHLDAILGMRDIVKLFPEQLMGVFPPSKNILYYGLNEEISPSSSTYFSETPLNFGYGATVTYPALQLGIYMGVRKIYLVGVDFASRELEALPREIRAMVAQNGEDAQAYNTCLNDVHWIEAHQQYAIKAFRTAQRFAAYRGISIMNASRGGQLEVYPRVRIDSLLG